jgi:Trk K+ transport system NAD-binding subunit
LILAISRNGHLLLSHGYTRLEIGDHVTVVGSPDSLAEVEVKLEV